MPWFICDRCGDSIKKPSLQKHFSQCGGCHSFTCIDCSATFDRRTVLLHSSCVTEHQKYALGATKPGGFAAQGFTGQQAPNGGASENEPTGLEFLSKYAPWKCSVCNVGCTSQDTLMSHAAGVKHKRRARAATAAANGEAPGGPRQPSETAAEGAEGAEGSAHPAAAQPAKRRAPASPSSSDFSCDEEESKAKAAAKRGKLAASAKRAAAASSSSDSDSSSNSEDDAPAAVKKPAAAAAPTAAAAAAEPTPDDLSSGSSSLSSDEADDEADAKPLKKKKEKKKPAKSSTATAAAAADSKGLADIDEAKMEKLSAAVKKTLAAKDKVGPKAMAKLAAKKLGIDASQFNANFMKGLLKKLESRGVGKVEGKKLLKAD